MKKKTIRYHQPINNQAGLIKLIVLIIAVIILLSYLGINIQKITESETGQANFSYVWQMINKAWVWFIDLYHQYLADPLNQLWNQFFLGQNLPNWLSSLKSTFSL